MFDYAAIHVGFKRFFCELWVLWLQLCTDMWVLSDFMYWKSISVHRHVGFKRFSRSGLKGPGFSFSFRLLGEFEGTVPTYHRRVSGFLCRKNTVSRILNVVKTGP